MPSKALFIDPWGEALYNDRLFDPASPLNRDDVTRPWRVLKETFETAGYEVHTADMLVTGRVKVDESLYLSIGQREFWSLLRRRSGVRLLAYLQLEPPVVDPAGYAALPAIHKAFERVFTHLPAAHGGTKLYWPQVKNGFVPLDDAPRKKLCMVNANKRPVPGWFAASVAKVDGENHIYGELYSERVRALDALGDRIDLYGPGWDGRPNWHGAPADKFAVLKQYDFALCFENQVMPGYLTEKAFECLFAGTIPVYFGCPDVASYIPPECFVDFRPFADYDELWDYLQDPGSLDPCRNAIRDYFASPEFQRYTCQHFAETILALARTC